MHLDHCQTKCLAAFVAILVSFVPARAVIKVATFSTVLTEVAQQVGGPQVEVMNILKPGVGPHHFRPGPADLHAIGTAQLILASGKGMETYLPEVTTAAPNATLIKVGDLIQPSLRFRRDSGPEIEDPHWWNSLANVEQAVGIVRDALSKISPTDQPVFTQRASDFETRLKTLDDWARAQVAELPPDRRKLVTSFDAFQYFARDYGFQLFTVKDLGPDDQPSSHKVAGIIAALKTQGAKAVFFEGRASSPVTASITAATGAKIGGKLYAHGPDTGDASTYEKVFQHNVTTIVEALK